MSILPTKILLATDGSEEAELAMRIAVDWPAAPTPSYTSSTSGACSATLAAPP